MAALLRNRWFQLAAVGVVAAFLLGFVSAVLLTAGPSGPIFGPVKLTTGGILYRMGPPSPGPMPSNAPARSRGRSAASHRY